MKCCSLISTIDSLYKVFMKRKIGNVKNDDFCMNL